MGYQHLTQHQRYQIATLHKGGLTSRQIADSVECHHSTVAREINRNGGRGSYRAQQAHRLATRRRHVASIRPRINPATWVSVEKHLREDWSPEQIVGSGAAKVSIERIYQHIAADRACGGDLWKHRRRRRRRKRIGTARHRQRFGGRRIEQRPKAVEARKQAGHWEADSVVGSGTVRLITLVERKSRYTCIRRVHDGKSRTATRAIVAALHGMGSGTSTITYDNGSEFAEHDLIDFALGTTAYFAEPHSPWQRGSNENTNGLIRQYIPKGASMDAFTDDMIQVIEDKLNNRPRKVLGFKTPREVLLASLKRRAS